MMFTAVHSESSPPQLRWCNSVIKPCRPFCLSLSRALLWHSWRFFCNMKFTQLLFVYWSIYQNI